MRIAFSGTHRVGKSTLLERVSEVLPRYDTVDEPYYLLEEEGYACAEQPSLDDFIAQLERSIAALGDAQRDTLFDRCPADILAYVMTHDDADAFDEDDWLDRARDAMQTLDLVVFVPIEAPDRIAVPSHEDRALRVAVHGKLEELLLDDTLGFGVHVLQVEGDLAHRARMVMNHVEKNSPRARRR